MGLNLGDFKWLNLDLELILGRNAGAMVGPFKNWDLGAGEEGAGWNMVKAGGMWDYATTNKVSRKGNGEGCVYRL